MSEKNNSNQKIIVDLKDTSISAISIFKIVAITAAFIAFAVYTPKFTNAYSMMILNISLINFIAALGLSVMLGMGGQLSFAAVSFMGTGAYFVANLTNGRLGVAWEPVPVLVGAVLFSAVFAYICGSILFRLSGTYFTFATIGLVQVTWSVYLNYRPLCGGPDGVSGIPVIRFFGMSPRDYHDWFYVLLIFVLLAGFLVERIRRTRLGRSLASVRDNEIAAQTLGVNIYKTKVIAFTVAGALSGLAGGLYAMHNQFISSDIFTFDMATTYVIMAMLGGVNNTVGVFVGALLVTMLPEWLRPIQRYLKLTYGVGIIFLMIFMPMGLAGLGNMILKKFFRRKKGQKETLLTDEDETGGEV
ncbi:branched-chain amino acid ABC transporter permease [Synergistales bacterium]|nr:branched-chain amino acid ABC transporter permease [Synergistales bacterium]